MAVCCYCRASFDHPDDTRPYGIDGADACFWCSMATPERAAEADRRRRMAVNAAFAEGPFVHFGGGPPRGKAAPEDGVIVIAAIELDETAN
jgi:hypothetical protein